MGNITRFSAVNTKIKALEAELITNKDYINLLEQKSVPDIAKYLKSNTAYKKVLDNVDLNNIHRADLEILIEQRLLQNIDNIAHFFNGEYKKFIYTLYAKYEIHELKEITRAIYNRENLKQYKNKVFIGKYSKVDEEKIFSAKNVRDVINSFEGTAFYKYLEPLLDNNEKENLFRFEMVLDTSYYEILQKQWEHLDKADAEVLEKAQGIMADLLNLQWIYRGIKFYKLRPEELINYTIYLGYRLKDERLKQLCYSNSLEEFFELAAKTRYSFLFKNDETTDIFMERRLERRMYFELKSVRRNNPISIIETFAYINFMEMEIHDIISIIELVRYEMPLADAKKYLVRIIEERE